MVESRFAVPILTQGQNSGQDFFLADLLFLAKHGMILGMPYRYRYFPAVEAQKEWGLFVTCAGRGQTDPGAEFPSHEHPDEYYFTWERGRVLGEWQIILVEEGRGEAEIGERRFELGSGSLLVLAPGVWHRYRPDPRTGWSSCWAGFGGDMAGRLVRGAGFGGEGGFHSVAEAPARALFNSAVADILSDGTTRPYAAAARLHTLLAELAEVSRGGESRARREEIVRRAQTLLAEKCGETIDLDALAASLGLPYRTFRHVFTSECGMPPHRWQLRMRLERAKRLLESSDIPVAEIAELLGFRSAWHFAHFFQRETGTSATRWRAARRGGPGGVV